MRIAILAACADTFYVLIDGLHFEPRCVDEFSKRWATLALRQPAKMSVTSLQRLDTFEQVFLRGDSAFIHQFHRGVYRLHIGVSQPCC